MKTALCLLALALAPLYLPAQQMLGGKTEGGGPNGSPATNCPCWRYPVRVINYRKFDLHPLFAWWRDNYAGYQAAVAAAAGSDKAPDYSALPPSPLPGWHRIKHGHFLSNSSYGWVCEATIEDVPTHEVTNKIILRTPPLADKAAWDNLLEQYEEMQAEGSGSITANNQKAKRARMRNPYANSPQDPQQQQQAAMNAYNEAQASAAGQPPPKSLREQIMAALDKFPEGTNYTVDLFAAKIGYLQDGTHRVVYDLGQMYAK